MSRSITDIQTLGTKFAVGEIADFVGVPNYYDAGDSKWLRTGVWALASSLPATVVNTIKSSNHANVALTSNALIDEFAANINGMLPAAVVGNIRCFPYSSNSKGTSAHAFVVNSIGAQLVNIGQQTGYSQGTNGCGNVITSDSTKFWSWTAASASAFGVKSSTEGIAWSNETLSGLPTFANISNYQIGGTSTNQCTNPIGDVFWSTSTYNLVSAYCGARHLLIGVNASNQYVATLSSNGTTFGGDQTTTVLGSATVNALPYCWWYRNNNNFYLTVGDVSRFSSDGGVTWAAATNAPASSYFYRINSTDAARIMSFAVNISAVKITTNSGQSWTNFTLPFTITSPEAIYTCGRGSTWVITSGGTSYKTTDDGTTWTALNAPLGFGAISAVYADANRWYMFSSSSSQIAVSTDLATWTIRNIENPSPGLAPNNFVATDANTVAGCHGGNVLYTVDGGVTWCWSYATNATAAPAAHTGKLIAVNAGISMFIGARTGTSGNSTAVYIPVSALSGTPYAVRSTTAAVTPLRANSLAFSRVA